MGQFLLERGPMPDLIMSSTAVRAIETVNLLTLSWPPVPTVETDAGLYLTGRHANLSRIARANDSHTVVMLVGHNPDIHLLALSLARSGHESDMKAMATKFPTGGLAHISLAINRWADLPSAIGMLERFVVPKSLLPEDHS
jgi:phosphohistidine phosphatase